MCTSSSDICESVVASRECADPHSAPPTQAHLHASQYFTSGLSSGDHQLTITVNGGYFDLDSIQVHSAVPDNNDASAATTSASTSASATATSNVQSMDAAASGIMTMSSGGMQMPGTNGSDPYHVNQADHSKDGNGTTL